MGFKLPKFNMRNQVPRKRDLMRLTNVSGRRIREPIPAKIKKETMKRANHKCQWPNCKEKEILDFHHKNMRNDDNRVLNIIVLCPTHHRMYHKKYKLKKEKDVLGRTIRERVIKAPSRKRKKRNTNRKNDIFGIGKLDFGI